MYNRKTADKECRIVYLDTLRSLMQENKDVVYLEADLAGALGTTPLFAEFPEQSINVGIMEANMVGMASGMSLKGKIPFVHSFGTFTSRRCADQTYLSACYNKANVRIIGSDPGVTAETNGGTHMPLEDVAIYRAFPGMTILDVAEPYLLEQVLRQSAKEYGVYYIRFPRKEKTAYYLPDQEITIGKGNLLKDGTDATIIASGIEVAEALKAAEELEEEGLSIRVVDMFTIKPLDSALVEQCCRETGAIVTAENHNKIGGLGSAVAEVAAESGRVPFARVGVPDRFGEVGDRQYLMETFGITKDNIKEAVRRVIKEK